MAIQKVNYADKQLSKVNPLPVEKQFRFQDANEIKNVINNNADELKEIQDTYPVPADFDANNDGKFAKYDHAEERMVFSGGSKEWQLQFFNQTVTIQLEATPNNIATFTSGVGTDVGDIEVSTDGVTYTPLVFPFTPTVGTWYFKRSSNLETGVYTISE